MSSQRPHRGRQHHRLSPLKLDDAMAIVIVLAFLGILILAAAILYLT
jgi:hypothetical protein